MTNKLRVPEEAPMSVAAREHKTSGFALPELEHNLQLLIDLMEQDILQSSRHLQYERDVVVTLELQSADEEVGQWQAILESGQLHHANAPEAHMDPYHRLLWEVWIPVL